MATDITLSRQSSSMKERMTQEAPPLAEVLPGRGAPWLWEWGAIVLQWCSLIVQTALIKLNESLKKDMGIGEYLWGRKRDLEGERRRGKRQGGGQWRINMTRHYIVIAIVNE